MKKFLYILFISMSILSCKKDEEKPINKNEVDTTGVVLSFNSVYENNQFMFNQFDYITSTSDTIKVQTIKFLMSNFKLQKTDNSWVSIPNQYGYLSLSENRKTIKLDSIQNGEYKAIKFKVGIDSILNHSDPTIWPANHALNPLVNSMHWGWSSGYIFSMFEGAFKNNGKNILFSFHVAREEFAMNYTINFPSTLVYSGSQKKIVFNTDVSEYLKNPEPFSLKTNNPINHSDPGSVEMGVFTRNMSDIFSVISIE